MDEAAPAPIAPPPFHLTGRLDGASPLLLASPHSGQWLPTDFLAASLVPAATLRRLEDAHVGALLRDSTHGGVPLIEATHGRAVLDLNRAEHEYDPDMLAGPLTPAARPSDRVRRGYGLFPRFAATGLPIHQARIAVATAAQWIETLHRPWHATIAAALAAARSRHGFAVLLDVHSMPSLHGARPAQLVLGDRFGQSAAPALVGWLEAAFAAEGLRVARNQPYAGGHDIDRHGAPRLGIHAVQLEFDRGLYMNPESLVPHRGYHALSAMLARVVAGLGEWLAGGPLGREWPLAAE